MCAKLASSDSSKWTPGYTSESKESDNMNATKCTSSRFQPIYKWSPKFNMACSEARQNEVHAKPRVTDVDDNHALIQIRDCDHVTLNITALVVG